MPRALIVTDHLPGHDVGFQKSGHGHYLQSFIDHFLRRGFETTLIVFRPKVDFVSIPLDALPFRVEGPAFRRSLDRLTLRAPADIARCAVWFVFSRLPRFAQNVASSIRLRVRRLKGYSHDLGREVSATERAYVVEAAGRIEPDVVVYDSVFNVCGKLGAAQHWVITHEVKYQRVRSFAERGVVVSPVAFDADAERTIIEGVGNVIAIQWDDAAAFRKLAPNARVVVVPVAMDVAMPDASRAPVPGRCLFVGSASFHNLDGIRWFLERCWPAIRSAEKNASLDIVGTVCTRLGSPPAGVRLLGVLDSIDRAYAQAMVAVVPLQIGSGLKVKIVEALAHGLPVVTTSVGAQGLGQIEPTPFAISDDPVDFSRRCIELLRSESARRTLAHAARNCAARFTVDNAFREFANASQVVVVAS